MLELRNITKIYPTGVENVVALRDVDLTFRSSEFVSILGPSGCGKTTMLNILGGLDRATDGELVINGRSTREYRDRDWDAYRNHSVGFVFQNYNLIPHQTVLTNVELALTLSGVGKAERRERAREALRKVGLGDQFRKKPSELSGGQMQRVAIARAIVNDPDIVLADEPTGALDTETSVQVMDILKEIAQDRLVVVVTHNPDLADRYATRIVRMLDGRVLSDSMPVSPEETEAGRALDAEKNDGGPRKKKPSMSFATSFGLSLKNLISKKGRTILTGFAGSIGIIGIALIYAVSNGMTNYITEVQEETLSSYPLTIEASHLDTSVLLSTFLEQARSGREHENDAVYQKSLVYDMMNAVSSLDEQENDLRSFKAYIEHERAEEGNPLRDALSAVQYTYEPELLVYTKNTEGEVIRSDTQVLMTELIRDYVGMDFSSVSGSGGSGIIGTSLLQSSSSLWRQLIPGQNGEPVSPVTERQYDVLYGRWPSRYDEIVIFIDGNNELDDLTVYALGLKSGESIRSLMKSAVEKEAVEFEAERWSYETICSADLRLILNTDCFVRDESNGTWHDLRVSQTGLTYLYDNALSLRVVGVVRPNEDAVGSRQNGAVGYLADLTAYLLERANASEAVKAQTENPDVDLFTGLPFRDEDGTKSEAEKAAAFRDRVKALDEAGKAEIYRRIRCIPDPAEVEEAVASSLAGMTREQMETSLVETMTRQTGMNGEDVSAYVASMSDEDLTSFFSRMTEEQYTARYAAGVMAQLSSLSEELQAGLLDEELPAMTDGQCAQYYDSVLDFSDASYEDNLLKLGSADPDDPVSINLYAATFADKDTIENAIASYNESVDELKQIRYTDYVGLMMSSITTIIDAIAYVLIAFVAVSLVVSSIMIGVITLISVQERTKEIGILRSIGASKKNVSGLFNAETVIIGFLSGALGVLITYLLCIPINSILRALTGINKLGAHLPPQTALILIGISMLLTLVAGIIPSRSAAKKDPVVALRTE